MASALKRLLTVAIIVLVIAAAVWKSVSWVRARPREVSFTEFLAAVHSNRVPHVTLTGTDIVGEFRDSATAFHTIVPQQYQGLANELVGQGIAIDAAEPPGPSWGATLISIAPVLMIVLLWAVFYRQMSSGGNRAWSFGKSRARLSSNTQKKVTFRDAAGAIEAKEELKEIVAYLREPQKFQQLGGRIPKGVLLAGPPGTGKTLLARAVAGEANVPFFSISGSDFVEMFVGVGASRVRDLFDQGKKNAPCIIFIDEIDAVGRHRGDGFGGGHDEREQTLNQLLVEMDGFESNEGVILIAATNRPDVLDAALLRAGRFDRTIHVPLPNTAEREEVLQIHTRKVPLDDKVELRRMAEMTSGFSGADLNSVVNEAALLAAGKNSRSVSAEDLERAIEVVRRGIKARLSLESNEDRWRVAIHEIGHLSCSFSVPCLERIEALSLHSPYRPTWFDGQRVHLPDVVTREVAQGTLVLLLAGRAAEEFFLQQVSSFSATDTAVATALAREMVSSWGMSDDIGLVNEQLIRNHSSLSHIFVAPEQHSRELDEIRRLLAEAYTTARFHIEQSAEWITSWAVKLLETETISSRSVEQARATAQYRVHPRRADLAPTASTPLSEIGNGQPRDVDYQVKRVSILRKHLDVIEMQLAALGLSAPPHLIIERDDLREQIRRAGGAVT